MDLDRTPSIDPFAPLRDAGSGVVADRFDGEHIAVVLRYRDVRLTAQDWRRFSSSAPGRVPIPAETDVRDLRQLPIETDPPDHSAYRAIVKPLFRRPAEPEVAARLAGLIEVAVAAAMAASHIEAVAGLALPLQSRALAVLLDLPAETAETWIGWGTHAFKVEGRNDPARAALLLDHILAEVDAALAGQGRGIYAALAADRSLGRPLKRDEMVGFMHVTFAGGRDTLIHMISGILGHLAATPATLDRLRAEPDLVATAVEEYLRYLSPLTHIGRVCPSGAELGGVSVPPGGRVALCWASANFDPALFEVPTELRLDRRPNPHVAFGSGDHNCLGSTHARAVLRALLEVLALRVARVEVLAAEADVKRIGSLSRPQGYRRLELRFHPLA